MKGRGRKRDKVSEGERKEGRETGEKGRARDCCETEKGREQGGGERRTEGKNDRGER